MCIPSEEQRMNNLAKAINELNANFMDLTPTVANLLNPSDVPTIKGMVLGGEALTKSVIDQWGTAVHLHGMYGPSEASSKYALPRERIYKARRLLRLPFHNSPPEINS